MLPACLTALLFSICAIYSNRSVAQMGANEANLTRLVVAVFFLALIAHGWGGGLGGAGFWLLLVSGIIGFGFGDIGVFNAYPRLGSRLTLLFTQCLAAPIAAIGEWYWLGTQLTPAQMLWGSVVLVGIALALAPEKTQFRPRGMLVAGIMFGLLAAFGQAFGAVISRAAYDVAEAAGQFPTEAGDRILFGITAAYQRVLGGVAIAALYLAWLRSRRAMTAPAPRATDSLPSKGLYVSLNALTGPVLGVSCFQWALATQPSGIVLPIVALTPVVVLPFSYFMENDRPSARSLLGGVIAVAAAVMLAKVTAG